MTDTIDVAALVAFANEAAAYFEKRDTGGEDMAHWANVYNAENCRKIATALQSLDGSRSVKGQIAAALGCEPTVEAIIAAATTAEAEAKAMREALEQAKLYVERDEEAHGRKFGTGNAIRAALAKEGK